MGTDALLIDFGGTLDADGVPWVERFFACYRDAGGVLERSAFGPRFSCSDDALGRLPGVARFDYSATVAAQAELLAPLLPDGERLLDPALQRAFVAAAATVAARNGEVLRELGESYRLAVVSNYQGNLEPCLHELGLGGLFDVVADSEVIGARKPDRRIFDATLAALGCEASQCWMIGDSPPNDIAAATRLGMRTCWIAPMARAVDGVTPTGRAARFDQVPLVLAA